MILQSNVAYLSRLDNAVCSIYLMLLLCKVCAKMTKAYFVYCMDCMSIQMLKHCAGAISLTFVCLSLVEGAKDLFLMQCHSVIIWLDTRVKKYKQHIILNSSAFVLINSTRSIKTDSIPNVNYLFISIAAYYCTDEGV